VQIFINRIIYATKAEGPGTRLCIYVQGCDICCDGCANMEMWDRSGGVEWNVDEVKLLIERNRNKIDGITILGGEPTLQAEALSAIVSFASAIGLNVILFTGRQYEDLKMSNDEAIVNLLNNVDLLIDGPYVKELHDLSRPLVGSSNQRYIFLTDRIRLSEIMKLKNVFEIMIDSSGCFFVNGMGDFEKIRSIVGGNT